LILFPVQDVDSTAYVEYNGRYATSDAGYVEPATDEQVQDTEETVLVQCFTHAVWQRVTLVTSRAPGEYWSGFT